MTSGFHMHAHTRVYMYIHTSTYTYTHRRDSESETPTGTSRGTGHKSEDVKMPCFSLVTFSREYEGGGQFTTTEVTSLLKDGSEEMGTLHPKSLGPCHFKFIVFLAWTHIHVLGGAQSGCFNEADVWVIPIWGLYHLWFSTSATGFGVLLGGEVGLWPCFT